MLCQADRIVLVAIDLSTLVVLLQDVNAEAHWECWALGTAAAD